VKKAVWGRALRKRGTVRDTFLVIKVCIMGDVSGLGFTGLGSRLREEWGARLFSWNERAKKQQRDLLKSRGKKEKGYSE